MEKTKVHNLIIVDASGSMDSIYNQALAGINETIKTINMVQEKDMNVDQTLTLLSFANGWKISRIWSAGNCKKLTPILAQGADPYFLIKK